MTQAVDELEMAQAVTDSERIVVRTALSHYSCVQDSQPNLSLVSHCGIVDFSPTDQVVKVRSGTMLNALNEELSKHGHTIPYRVPTQLAMGDQELHSLIDFDLPHALQAQCGSWRDWVLGMRIVLADGSIRKSGSTAVKNVAGYDVHKLMVGARGTLGIVSEITLRTWPLSAVPACQTIDGSASGNHPHAIHRTTLGRYQDLAAEAGSRLISGDPMTGTVWAVLGLEDELSKAAGDWVLYTCRGSNNLRIIDTTQIRLMKRAKEIFDPTYKLNAGGMGIF